MNYFALIGVEDADVFYDKKANTFREYRGDSMFSSCEYIKDCQTSNVIRYVSEEYFDKNMQSINKIDLDKISYVNGLGRRVFERKVDKWKSLKVGDVIKNIHTNYKRKVLAICDDVYCLSDWQDYNVVAHWITLEQLKKDSILPSTCETCGQEVE